jgi:hypothetical protein
MLPALQSRFDAIEDRRKAFLARLGNMDAAELGYRPRPSAWSLLQVAQHLVLLEQLVLKTATRDPRPGVRRRWWHRIGGWMVAFVFRFGLRVPAPTRMVVPIDQKPLGETAAEWSELRAKLAAFLETCTPERAKALGFRHPLSGPQDVYGALDFLAGHHDHHLRQVARIQNSANWPSSSSAA